MVVRLIEAHGTELALDFELAPNVYAKAKVRLTTGVWLNFFCWNHSYVPLMLPSLSSDMEPSKSDISYI